MRSFFWLLVVVNLVYFGWRQFGAELVAQAPEAPQAAVPSLTLLSELPQSPAPRTVPLFPPEPQPQSASDAGAATAPEPGASNAAELAARTAAPIESSRECSVVAGFAASDLALTLVQALQGAGIEAFTVSGDAQAVSVWWVYLPKFASEELARRTLSELREKGIDSYYLSSGELQGGISLGVFARREGAERTQQELAQRGYTANIQETTREAAGRYRVVAESTREALLAASGMQDFMENNPGLDVSDFVCEGVAEPK
jgi:cell division septation protein DedD